MLQVPDLSNVIVKTRLEVEYDGTVICELLVLDAAPEHYDKQGHKRLGHKIIAHDYVYTDHNVYHDPEYAFLR